MERSTFNLADWLPAKKSLQGLDETTVEMDLERVTCAIEATHTDLTANYESWLQIGFALAHELGEPGRSYFQRISRFYPKYSQAETDKKYDRCLKGNRQGVTIKTFFYLAKQAGVDISKEKPLPAAPPKRVLVSESDEEPPEEEVCFRTPQLPAEVYENLPGLLSESTRLFTKGIEKDIFCMSALAVLSCCLPNLEGIYFNRPLSPHLFLFITGPSASGKGTMIWSRYLADEIHNEFVRETHRLREAYVQALADYEALSKSERNGVEKPMEPARKMFFIPANSSASAMIKLLAENNFQGLIFETEADTLANTNKQDWGDSSDVFRKAFHHENTSMARRKDNEYIEIKDPHLGICLSGTPHQVHNLMPDVENGLFSRFMYYAFEDKRGFLNPFVSYQPINYNLFFTQKGYEVFHLFDKLRQLPKPIVFQFTEAQAIRFTTYFSKLLDKNTLLLSKNLDANTKRLGVITFRLAMTLSALRLMELEPGVKFPDTLVCSDRDFQTAITIATTLETHASAVYQRMPKITLKGKRLAFFEKLPEKFTRLEYLAIAKTLEINARTAERYIAIFKEKLLDYDYNNYQKRINA